MGGAIRIYVMPECTATNAMTTVKPSPVLTTTASGPTLLGQAIHDTAHLSGGTAPLTGILTFNVYRPDDATCSTPIVVPPAIPLNGAGSYPSGNFTPTLPGTYRWIAHYSGDGNQSGAEHGLQ